MAASDIQIVIAVKDMATAGLKAAQTAMTGLSDGAGRAHKAMAILAGTSSGLSTTLAGLAAAIGGGAIFTRAASAAVSFNSTLEQSKIGLAALVRQFNDMGNGTEAMNQSMEIAAQIQRELQIEGLKTTATYEQLLVALQEGIGPAFKQGFDPKQVVEFTSLMTQAAAAISLPMDQLGQELRAILDGTIDKNARIAKALGLTNEKIKEMAASGKLFEYLKEKLAAFGQAGDDMAKTFTGAMSNLQDAIRTALGTGLQKSFESAKKFLLDLSEAIVQVDEKAKTFRFHEGIVRAMERIDAAISGMISGAGSNLDAWIDRVASTAASVVEALAGFARAVGTVVSALGPLLPILSQAVVYYGAFKVALGVLVGVIGAVLKATVSLGAAFKVLTGVSIVAWAKDLVIAFQAAAAAAGLLTTAFGLLFAAVSIDQIIKAISAFMAYREAVEANVQAAAKLTAESEKLSWAKDAEAKSTAEVVAMSEAERQAYIQTMEAKLQYLSLLQQSAILTDKDAAETKRLTSEVDQTARALIGAAKAQGEFANESKRAVDEMGNAIQATDLTAASSAKLSDTLTQLAKDYEATGNTARSVYKDMETAAAEAGNTAIEQANKVVETERKKYDLINEAAAKSTEAKIAALDKARSGQEAYVSKSRGLTEELLRIREEAARKWMEAIQKALDQAISEERRYADEVRRIEDEIVENRKKGEEILQDIRREGMTEEERWADKRREALELERKAREELAKGTKEGAQAAKEYAAQAVSLWKELSRGAGDAIDKQKAVQEAFDGTTRAVKLANDALKTQATLAEKTRVAWSSMAEALLKDLEASKKTLDDISKAQITAKVDVDDSEALRKLAEIRRDTSSTHTVYVKSVEMNAAGGPAGWSRPRGHIPGDGNADDVPALLMRGEYVIKKDAVKKYGLGVFHALNNGLLPAFANGGPVLSGLGQKALGWLADGWNTAVRGFASGGNANLGRSTFDIQREYQQAVAKARRQGDDSLAEVLERELDLIREIQRELQAQLRELKAEYDRQMADLKQARSQAESELSEHLASDPRTKAGGFAGGLQNDQMWGSTVKKSAGYQEYYREKILPWENKLSELTRTIKDLKSRPEELRREYSRAKADAERQAQDQITKAKAETRQQQDQIRRETQSAIVKIGQSFTATKAGNYAVRFADGGPVSGGTPNADSVRAMLMPGEYVVRKAVVERMGQGFFDRLNNGPWRKFAEGGPVGGSSGQADTVNVNLNLGGKTFGLQAGRSTAADLVRELRRSGLAGA